MLTEDLSRLSVEQRQVYAALRPDVEVTRVDTRTFMERLFSQRSEVLKHLGRDGSTLYVGAEVYQQLIGETGPLRYLEWRDQYGSGMQICGLTVKVLPWFDGLLVAP